MRLGLTENLSRARTRNDTLDERVRRAFGKFNTATPATDRLPASDNHIEPGVAPFEAVDRVIRKRLDDLSTAPPGAGMAIRANSSLIRWDDAVLEAGQAKSGSIELGALIDLLNTGGVSSLTLPADSAVAACEAERKARAVVEEIDSVAATGHHESASANESLTNTGRDSDTPDGADDDTAQRSEKLAELVDRSVHQQMAPASAPEERLRYGLIPNGADSNEAQARLLDTFQLRPGPTDVTSYHDFSTLRIAFEDVWTRIFDGELEALGRQIYREYVELKDFLGYDPDTADRPISSLDDLVWLVGEIRSLSQFAQKELPGGGDTGHGETGGVPKDPNKLARDAEKFVESLPGGRVVTAIGTLGISELVLWFIRESASFGRKEALRWDDLVKDRRLSRGDRISGEVDEGVVPLGDFQLVLWTDYPSNRKEIAFQVLNESTQKMDNIARAANWVADVVNHSGTGQPTWYVHRVLVPSTNLTSSSLLEFASEETPGQSRGRYVLGDLDKIVADGGRLTFYWRDS